MIENLLTSITKKYSMLSKLTWMLLGVITVLLFLTLSVFKHDESTYFLNADYDWYTVIEKEDNDAVLADLKFAHTISEQASFKLIRMTQNLERIDLNGGLILSTIYLSNTQFIKGVEFFDGHSELHQNAILVSKKFWQQQLAPQKIKVKQLKVNDVYFDIAGIVDFDHGEMNVDAILNIKSYPGDTNWKNKLPNEVSIVGIDHASSLESVTQNLKELISSVDERHNTHATELKIGLYFSDFDLSARQSFSFITKANSNVILLCFFIITLIFSEKISLDIINFWTICTHLGLQKKAKLKIFIQLFYYLLCKALVYSLSLGLVLQLTLFFTNSASVVRFLPTEFLDFFILYIPLSLAVSISYSLIIITHLFFRIYSRRLNTLSNIRIIQVKVLLNVSFVFLLLIYGAKVINSVMPSYDDFYTKIEYAKDKGIIVLELQSNTKNENTFGKIIYSQNIEELKDALNNLITRGEIRGYSGSSMYPFFNGGSYRQFKDHHGSSIDIYENSIFGQYFSLLDLSSVELKKLDRQVESLPRLVEMVGSKQLEAQLIKNDFLRLLSSVFIIDLNGKRQKKEIEVRVDFLNSDLPYNGFTNKMLPVAYIRGNGSVTLNYLAYIPGGKYSKETYENIIEALPTDLTIKKAHNLVDIARNDLIIWLFKFIILFAVVSSLSFVIILISEMSLKTFFLDIKENIRIMRLIGASKERIYYYSLTLLFLPWIFTILFVFGSMFIIGNNPLNFLFAIFIFSLFILLLFSLYLITLIHSFIKGM